MALHSWELQKAVYSKLTAASITDYAGDAITGVFDDVPTDTAYPYVVIGDETATNISAKDKDFHEHTLTIHIWSQYRGNRDIKEIMEHCVELSVPVKVDVDLGPNWGEAKDAEKAIKHAESVRGWTRGAESDYTKQAV